jgi:hypothetical protein
MKKTSNFLLPVLLMLISIGLTLSVGTQILELSRWIPDLSAETVAKKASFNSNNEPIVARSGKDIRVDDPAHAKKQQRLAVV